MCILRSYVHLKRAVHKFEVFNLFSLMYYHLCIYRICCIVESTRERWSCILADPMQNVDWNVYLMTFGGRFPDFPPGACVVVADKPLH